MKRINKDENGIGALTILVILVVFVISWQVIAPSLKFPTPYALLTGETEITSELYIVDRVTGEQTLLTEQFTQIDQIEGHLYDAILKTNAPFIFYDVPYRQVYSIKNLAWLSQNNGNLGAFSKPLPISAIWSNSFIIPLNTTITHDLDFEFHFYDSSGILIDEWDLIMWHVPGYGDFP